jgi:hypothetical protein
MPLARILRALVISTAALTMLAGQAALDTASAAGTLSVSKASLQSGRLTVEGSGAATGFIAARSTTSAAGARAGLDGRFKIQASGFTAPDCKVVLQDNKSNLLTVTLSGCTPTTKPVTPPAGPTGTCVITPPTGSTNLPINQMGVVWFHTTGCNTTADGDRRRRRRPDRHEPSGLPGHRRRQHHRHPDRGRHLPVHPEGDRHRRTDRPGELHRHRQLTSHADVIRSEP